MTTNPSRFTHLRAGATVAAVLLATLAACEAKLPTSAEVQNMDVASAEKSAAKVNLLGNTHTVYVDGKLVDEATAHAIAPERIASMNLEKQPDGSATIRITTLASLQSLNADGTAGPIHMKVSGQTPFQTLDTAVAGEMHMRHAYMTAADTAEMAKNHRAHAAEMKRTFDGVLLVDGVAVDNSAMEKLDPSQISSINIYKGAGATAYSKDPKAVNGVIVVVTRAGAKK